MNEGHEFYADALEEMTRVRTINANCIKICNEMIDGANELIEKTGDGLRHAQIDHKHTQDEHDEMGQKHIELEAKTKGLHEARKAQQQKKIEIENAVWALMEEFRDLRDDEVSSNKMYRMEF